MRGSIDDLVALTLLVAFFGVSQRHRQQLYFRFWCVGWGLVCLSIVAWEWPVPGVLLTEAQDVLRYELLLMGTLLFLLSLLVTPERLRQTCLWGMVMFVPAAVGVAVETLSPQSAMLLSAIVVVGQAAAVTAGLALLPKEWRALRWLICMVAGLSGAAMLVLAQHDDQQGIVDFVLCEILASTAVLYAKMFGGRRAGGWLGPVGFGLWGVFYLFDAALPATSWTMVKVYELWNLPKDLVGFAMILHVFEESRRELAGLADEYRLLYKDFRMLYEGHPFPMWIYEAQGHRILSVNQEAVRVYGYKEAEFLALRVQHLEPPPDSETEAVASLLPPPPDGERTRHRYKDGRLAWVNIVESGIVFQGKDARVVLARDITDRLKINQELAHKAHHDALTGLPNRLLFADRLQQSLSRCKRDGRKAVLLMIDLDHFKRVNDGYGHLLGDECLREVAVRLAAKIRQVDTIARVGGEEFAAVIGGLSGKWDAEKVAAMLLAQFDQPLRVGGIEMKLTVSIGAALFPEDGEADMELLDLADRALYQAKRMGRNQVVFWGEGKEDANAMGEITAGA